MTESDLINTIRLEASKLGVRVFRNNVGVLQSQDGRYVRYGLCVGSSDLIGWTPVEIDGRPRGLFTAIECKYHKTKTTKEQLNFIEAVRKSGGLSGVVHSVEEAINLLRGGMRDGDREWET